MARLMVSLATSSKTTDVVKMEGSFEQTIKFRYVRREIGLNSPAASFEDSSECPEHLNQVAFHAHLTNERFFPDMYWAFESFWVFDCIEVVGSSEACVISNSGNIVDWKMDCTVSSAAIWIIIAGQTIWNQLVESPVDSLGHTHYKSTEFGLARWVRWRKGFEAIVGGKKGVSGGVSGEEAKKLATKAANFMRAIEENMAWD